MSDRKLFPDSAISLFGTVTLGALIDALEPLQKAEKFDADDKDSARSVYFDFGGLVPHYFDSYRGFYDHLAITYHNAEAPSVSDLLAKLKAADGQVFDGYKGGSFRMDRRSPVWVANHGNCDSTAIVGLMVEGWRVTILTEYRPV